jgi:ribosomal protein S6
MPPYQQLIVTMPKVAKESLVRLFKSHSEIVMKGGGVVRGIENHGVRPLPSRARRKFTSTTGERYFWDARFTTTTFDVSPDVLVDINRFLRDDEAVLRYFTIKQDDKMHRVASKNYKNPYHSEQS